MGKNATLVIAKGIFNDKPVTIMVRKENGKLSFAFNGEYTEFARVLFESRGAFRDRGYWGEVFPANTLLNCINILENTFFDDGSTSDITVIGEIDEEMPRIMYV